MLEIAFKLVNLIILVEMQKDVLIISPGQLIGTKMYRVVNLLLQLLMYQVLIMFGLQENILYAMEMEILIQHMIHILEMLAFQIYYLFKLQVLHQQMPQHQIQILILIVMMMITLLQLLQLVFAYLLLLFCWQLVAILRMLNFTRIESRVNHYLVHISLLCRLL